MSRAKRCTVLSLVWGCVLAAEPCRESDNQEIQALIARTQWSQYWGRDAGRYPAGKSATLRVFASKSTVGYCSLQLDRCVEYLRGSSGQPGVERYEVTKLSSKVDLTTHVSSFLLANAGLDASTDAGRSYVFEGADKTRSQIDASMKGLISTIERLPVGYRACDVRIESLPPPIPDAIRMRRVPNSAKSIQELLKKEAVEFGLEISSHIEYIVPFFSDEDLYVYVLYKINGNIGSISVFSNDNNKWVLVYHFDGSYDKKTYERIRQRILNAKMAVVP